MKKIFVLWPTVRPAMFIQTVNDWIERSVNEHNIYYLPRVTDNVQANEINMCFKMRCNVFPSVGNTSLSSTLYGQCLGMDCEDTDIILVAQDDLYPPNSWDEIVLKEFEDHDGAVFFNDGIQVYPADVCVMPCLTFKALKMLNMIIYHPDYKHLYPDREYYHNCIDLGILKDVRETNTAVFEHRHYSNGKRTRDSIDDRATLNEAEDLKTFDRRMLMPVAERMKV